ncbi:sodium:calcium antiporter [Propioniciclava sp. MC1683]|uniref:sodium:calcium antiporter n=1 Tax=Propioniciclava sp. MC1683 TaxID=2760309 RepID=UPI0016006361|nr:sodium:calcium antiporter [Propioniciclava sp. MC1683]MBB1500494.1 sodium:calcium antiporter [Propioniciclava sp. MC1683]
MTDVFLAWPVLLVVAALVVSLVVLGKSADILVDNAVALSKVWGMPELVVGATIVSLGTTLPELAASGISALQGSGEFALGNAVGSIITNTSLILGLGAVFGAIAVGRAESQKLSILLAATAALIVPTLVTLGPDGQGHLPRWMGVVLLVSLPVYLWWMARQRAPEVPDRGGEPVDSGVLVEPDLAEAGPRPARLLAMVALGAVGIAGSAVVLVGSAEALAIRAGVPEFILAVTLVAFGTSVPELTTVITAARRGYGGLALGNVLGANVLNIVLVSGFAAAVMPGGIPVGTDFMLVSYPALFIILGLFGWFAYNTKVNEIRVREGIALVVIYVAFLAASLLVPNFL